VASFGGYCTLFKKSLLFTYAHSQECVDVALSSGSLNVGLNLLDFICGRRISRNLPSFPYFEIIAHLNLVLS